MYIRTHNIIYIQIIQEQMTQMGKDTLPHLYSSIKKWLEMSRVYVCFYSAACCCRSLRCAKRPLFAFVAPEILARPTFLTLVRIFDVSRCGEHMVFSSAVAEKPWHVKRQKDAVVSSAKFHGFWRWIQLSFDVCSRILWWSSSFSNHQEQPSLPCPVTMDRPASLMFNPSSFVFRIIWDICISGGVFRCFSFSK